LRVVLHESSLSCKNGDGCCPSHIAGGSDSRRRKGRRSGSGKAKQVMEVKRTATG
jgi:hypothetical protein